MFTIRWHNKEGVAANDKQYDNAADAIMDAMTQADAFMVETYGTCQVKSVGAPTIMKDYNGCAYQIWIGHERRVGQTKLCIVESK